tara:strand:- start:428 stop:1072 length:645 start_codon:yes stop_codon:yes gene_type:complete
LEQIIEEIFFKTKGEGFTNITSDISDWLKKRNFRKGILVISLKHTSCSLIINENADPNVLKDLSAYMKAIVPEGGFKSINRNSKETKYLHSEEGPDDMPAHIRTALTCSTISLSINESEIALGTWQAIYLWEHRYSKNIRAINLHAIGNLTDDSSLPVRESMTDILTRRNPEKINQIVSKINSKNTLSIKNASEINKDLLIDRIHDLSSNNDSN